MVFRVGQKVICVMRTIDPRADAHPGLVIDKIYTVTDVIMHPHWTSPGLLLAEILPRDRYVAFESLMFRPVTDISVFTAMLNTSKQGQDA